MNVIAIFDIGKTNKKLFLFDEHYKIVYEQTDSFAETTDEEGQACEDVDKLAIWVRDCCGKLAAIKDFTIRAVNFSAYGASFVNLGADGRPLTPLYNYLKPYPDGLKKKFYDTYGGEITFSMLTASPVLGSLNSGMQLYRMKEERPELFDKILCSLHLPQYISYLLTGKMHSDITSIGCHTNLWNFSQHNYHEWVYREGVIDKLAQRLPSGSVVAGSLDCRWAGLDAGGAGGQGGHAGQAGGGIEGGRIAAAAERIAAGGPETEGDGRGVSAGMGDAWAGEDAGGRRMGGARGLVAGIGLHDSSSAMIPYLESFREPFVLISTGTWCISMNPFNDMPLTVAELQKDCLCYLSYQGRPVKASRLFAGYEHEQQIKRLGAHFNKQPGYANTIAFEPEIVSLLEERELIRTGAGWQAGAGGGVDKDEMPATSAFGRREMGAFGSYEEAYHRLIMDIMAQQVVSTGLVLAGTDVKRIFVDGGFGRNQVYMNLLACAFPHIEVFAASISQATAMGAALAIHQHWNSRPLPGDIIELKYYVACK